MPILPKHSNPPHGISHRRFTPKDRMPLREALAVLGQALEPKWQGTELEIGSDNLWGRPALKVELDHHKAIRKRRIEKSGHPPAFYDQAGCEDGEPWLPSDLPELTAVEKDEVRRPFANTLDRISRILKRAQQELHARRWPATWMDREGETHEVPVKIWASSKADGYLKTGRYDGHTVLVSKDAAMDPATVVTDSDVVGEDSSDTAETQHPAPKYPPQYQAVVEIAASIRKVRHDLSNSAVANNIARKYPELGFKVRTLREIVAERYPPMLR